MDEPNWVVLILVGAIAWPILSYGGRAASLAYRKYLKPSYLTGEWHEYNLSRKQGELVVSEEAWRVKPGLTSELTFRAEAEGCVYKGTLRTERNHVVAEYSAEHEESVFCRLQRPAVPGAPYLVGLWVGYDFDGELFAGPQILSRRALEGDEARRRLCEAATALGRQPAIVLAPKAVGTEAVTA